LEIRAEGDVVEEELEEEVALGLLVPYDSASDFSSISFLVMRIYV